MRHCDKLSIKNNGYDHDNGQLFTAFNFFVSPLHHLISFRSPLNLIDYALFSDMWDILDISHNIQLLQQIRHLCNPLVTVRSIYFATAWYIDNTVVNFDMFQQGSFSIYLVQPGMTGPYR